MHKQVGVGIVEKVHGDPASDTATFDIRFCPPKGAKHQTAKRPNTLYQNVNASMDFNLNYALTSGACARRGISNQQARYPQKRTRECFVGVQS